MTDFRLVEGFEDVWRPPVRARAVRPESVLGGRASSTAEARTRLTRVVARAPEVMVKVTGRTRDGAHLRAHLDYISRHGQLPLEHPEGGRLEGRAEVRDQAEAWAHEAQADLWRRRDSPVSHSLVLSMPAGTEPLAVRDAAAAFAMEVFAGRHDYVFTLHTDTARPHVHLSVCSRGLAGGRLNPKKADLDHWRQVFAQALRDRGVEAEATPRRARGVVRKPERMPIRKISDRGGQPARVTRGALHEAGKLAFGGDRTPRPWEVRSISRQNAVRQLYLKQAELLARSPDPEDRRLSADVVAFVQSMPQAASRRLELARALRAANRRDADRNQLDPRGKERSR